MFVVSDRKSLFLLHTLLVFSAVIETATSDFMPECQSCQLTEMKKLFYGSPLCNCAYNVTVPRSQTSNWRVVCRTEDTVFLHQSTNFSLWYFVGTKEEHSLTFLALTNQSQLTIKNLTEGSSYVFAFAKVSPNRSEVLSVENVFVETLSDTRVESSPVEDIELISWIPKKGTVSANIRYKPGKWNSCYFDFIWQTESEIYKKELRSVNVKQEVILDKMKYDSNYTIIVTSLLNGEKYAESPPATFFLKTPQCADLNPPGICPPGKLENVVVEEILAAEGFGTQLPAYNVSVRWKRPTYEPLYAIVSLQTDHENGSYSSQKSVPGNETSISFSRLTLGSLFRIQAWAVTAGGPGPPVKITRVITASPDTKSTAADSAHKMLFLVLGVGYISAAVVLISCIRLKKVNGVNKESGRDLEIITSTTHCKSNLLQDSGYEVPRDSVILHGIVGEGAFGIVRKGCLMFTDGTQKDVAVKTLKGKPSGEEKGQLVQELEILQTIGQHDHVVSLVACCTDCPIEETLIIVEYCAFGDLQHYLQNSEYSENSKMDRVPGLYENVAQAGVTNQLYDTLNDVMSSSDTNQLSMYDLVCFCYQVAEGMVFLSDNRIIHRDLAARNVLVTADKTLKISDFGLSRDIYLNDCYTKTSNGKVPIKWIAIESLLHQKYTMQSDVWSFGVLMWEIMTFGATPYDVIPPTNLKEYLSQGHRLPCPEIASSDVYSIMLSCWQAEPFSRPHFYQLKATLHYMLKTLQ